MKTIGLIGGMSWESSAEYYRFINTRARERTGGHAIPPSLMLTLNFAEIESLQHARDWQTLGRKMAAAARQLQAGGADVIVLCTNTMHKVAAEIEAAVSIPFLHIADAMGEALVAAGIVRASLLGTKFSMEDGFYHRHLSEKYGLVIETPGETDRDFIHEAIYRELCLGVVREETRSRACDIIRRLVAQGAGGIILGCTELGMLLRPVDCPVPLFDSTRLHAAAALEWALKE